MIKKRTDTQIRRQAREYIKWHFLKFEILPTEESVIDYLADKHTPLKTARRIVASVYENMHKRKLVTDVGRFSGRRHLTSLGFEHWRVIP